MIKTCVQCGREFKGYTRVKYCSDYCRNQAYRLRYQEERICEICGKKFMCSKYEKTTACSKVCGGKKQSKNAAHLPRITMGYRIIYCPEHSRAKKGRASRGYVQEHILVWTEYHKRQIPEGHVIHHIDGDKLNNSIENLELRAFKKHPPGQPPECHVTRSLKSSFKKRCRVRRSLVKG